VQVAKITTLGNSLGIVLSREILARLRVDKGDLLYLVESPLGFEIMPYEPQFIGQLQRAEELMRAQRNALKVLSDSGVQPKRVRLGPKGEAT